MSSERVWLITGTAAGFGRRLVYSVLSRGDKVIATARCLRLLDLDVTAGFNTIKEKVDKAVSFWGRIDVLVNNAGYGVPAILEEGGAPSYAGATIGYNCKHRQSVISTNCIQGIGPYSASKAALHALTETLSIELAQFNIKVLLVAPGAFKTEGAYNYPWDNPNPLPAYENIRAAALAKFGSIRDAIKGDPNKAMEVVVDVVRGEGVAKGREWPGYLILGEDAEVDIRNKIGKITKVLDDWGDVARGVSFS